LVVRGLADRVFVIFEPANKINLFLSILLIENASPNSGFITSVYVLNEPIPLNGFRPCLLTCNPKAFPPACTKVLIGVYTPSFSKPLA